MCAAAKFHRITIEGLCFTADLHYPNRVSIFFPEKLLNIRALPRFRVRDLHPGYWSVFRDPFIDQLLDRANLLFRKRCAREIERQLVGPDIAALLSRIG